MAEAAADAGMSERTVYRRLADPQFTEKLQSLRTQILVQAVGKLVDASVKAAETLKELCEADSEQVRLGASRSILELSCKLHEKVALKDSVAMLEQQNPIGRYRMTEKQLSEWYDLALEKGRRKLEYGTR
jgi:hypothetical protein